MSTLGDPARGAFAVTTNNTSEQPARAFYVGGTGDVAVVPHGSDSPIVLKSVPAGSIIPMQVKIFRTTSTTATDIVAFT